MNNDDDTDLTITGLKIFLAVLFLNANLWKITYNGTYLINKKNKSKKRYLLKIIKAEIK